MKTISVIGSCVCRDLFEKDNGENYSFHTDIRFSSPISMLSDPVDFIRADFDNFKKKVEVVGTNWYKKNLINDINKTAFEALENNHGEYLVLDFAEARTPLAIIRWKDKPNHSLLVSNSITFREQYNANLSKNILNNTILEIVSPLSYSDDFWKKTIFDFSERIKNIFLEDKIVLIKTKPARYYVDSNFALHPYNTSFHFGQILTCDFLLDKLYRFFIECCPNCKVIEIPENAIGWQLHKWGNHPFHFTSIYYEYLLKAVNEVILQDNPMGAKQCFVEYNEKFSNDLASLKFKTASAVSSFDYEPNFIEILNVNEEFNMLGKKKKLALYLAFDKKHFLKHFARMIRKKH